MKYGYFDMENREYVVERVDTPVSWTNYIGVKDMCAVLNQTAGGYSFYKSPQYHRITRFRPNGVPLDRPGHWVYIRDDESGEYWSISWQPVGVPLDEAKYQCRHGMSYSKYSCDYRGISADQLIFIPLEENVELWDVRLKNCDGRPRKLSVYSYIEWSYHLIDIDNQNFQMSNYCAGSSYHDGIIQEDLFYEEFGYQFFASDFTPDGYDTVRDKFIGAYHTESDPIGVKRGKLENSTELTGNHCAVLQRKLTLGAGEETRLIFMLGEGMAATEGARIKRIYSDHAMVDSAFASLGAYWTDKISRLQVKTPNQAVNESLNVWTLYQAEINVMFSRFASFIEVGGRTGLGYRDTAQDAMCVPHSNPSKTRSRIIELLRGETQQGYGLHLFQPEWFEPNRSEVKPFKSPTVMPEVDVRDFLNRGLKDVCSDDALWLIATVSEYIKETGELALLDEIVTYADGGEGSVYEHLCKILDFSAQQVGASGICKGLRADWNDCLNLGGGESAMVSFLHHWALEIFIELAEKVGRADDAARYRAMAAHVKKCCNDVLWDGDWYIRGITNNGKRIGTAEDAEGKVHLESNAWAVLSGVAEGERAIKAMDAIDKYLYTEYGLMLNYPSYTVPDDDIGFITRVYQGIKENGSIFSHANPWAWVAEAKLGRGDRLMKFYNALLPMRQNDRITVRQSEPYSYCQFIYGKDHAAHGRARHPFMTGSGGWAYYAATRYMLGIRPSFEHLTIDPCIPAEWREFFVDRKWRGATYQIHVLNPHGVENGVQRVTVKMPDGKTYECGKDVPRLAEGEEAEITVILG